MSQPYYMWGHMFADDPAETDVTPDLLDLFRRNGNVPLPTQEDLEAEAEEEVEQLIRLFELNAEAPWEKKPTRKEQPLARGLLDYFPDALLAVANCSFVGNEQHNPGQVMHWAREKSTDHADCLMRHLVDRGAHDEDGVRHSAKVAWRALALLQKELEQEEK